MTTTTAQDESIEHTAVGKLIDQIDKAMKRNPAMPTGEFWRFYLKALLTEMHQFHIDYTDDAAEEAGGGISPAYVDDLVELAQEGRNLVFALTTLLMSACEQAGYLDAEKKPGEQMPKDVRELLGVVQGKAREWLGQYGELIEDADASAEGEKKEEAAQ